ncbi:MAG: family 78 glycoside hydrolase catalytic domain [Promethearchaeota archaeon]
MIHAPKELKCEYLKDPINIDVPHPRFSWILEHEKRAQKQKAYQIMVCSSKEKAEKEIGDLWDSGRVESEKNMNIPHKGKELSSNQIYYWRVKWWDKNDVESDYSDIATFQTALLKEKDWKGKWITVKDVLEKSTKRKLLTKTFLTGFARRIKLFPAFYFRKEFSLEKPIKMAKIHVCGLGYHELHVNGKRIGTHVLDPAWTDYKKLALYSTFDIIKELREKNAIGVIVGNGRNLSAYGYDFPKLILQLHIKFFDGSETIITTDETWKASVSGPIRENGIYFGENYDARLEMPGWDEIDFDDDSWDFAVAINGPKLAAQLMQPIEITKILQPKKMVRPKPGVYIFDFEQNFTGVIRLKVRGSRGQQIKICHAELLNKDGTLNMATTQEARATDVYTLKGGGLEVYQPRFTYHGFRYVEITSYPGVPKLDDIEGLFFHTNVKMLGTFHCSNQLINKIHENIIWGQLSNLMSVPTDCPQRAERQGWTGDAQLTVEEAIYNFNMARFYTKYLRDIQLCQKENGSISDVVPPYWKLYPADPAWGSAYITLAWYLYWYYEDKEILKMHYPYLKKYINFLTSKAENHLILTLKKYGDWCPPGSIHPKRTPLELTSSWYYYHDTLLLSKISELLSYKEDHEELKNLAENIKTAFNQRFLDQGYESKKIFKGELTPNQTSNILPLYLDMVPEKKRKQVISLLLESIRTECDYHVDTGIIGTRYLFDVLSKIGQDDVAYKIVTQESYPSWGYMIKEGATTLWERWEKLGEEGMNSHNHIMLGSVDTWFYKNLAGIRAVEPGWKRLEIKPYINDELTHVSASLNTYRGYISVSWEKTENTVKMTIFIPVNCNATLSIPRLHENIVIKEGGSIVFENDSVKNEPPGMKYKNLDEKFINFEIGSGFYQISIVKKSN